MTCITKFLSSKLHSAGQRHEPTMRQEAAAARQHVVAHECTHRNRTTGRICARPLVEQPRENAHRQKPGRRATQRRRQVRAHLPARRSGHAGVPQGLAYWSVAPLVCIRRRVSRLGREVVESKRVSILCKALNCLVAPRAARWSRLRTHRLPCRATRAAPPRSRRSTRL
jgi:hypothetical protein